MEANGWIDVSVSLRSGMVHWPDNPPVQIERALSIERGDAANVSEISMGAHTGTHMDGPIHFVREGRGLDEMPLEATIGPARAGYRGRRSRIDQTGRASSSRASAQREDLVQDAELCSPLVV
jgi:hypothetical protein